MSGAGLLSGFILGVIGFDQNVAVQSEETLAQLRMAFIGVPVSGTLIALWAMRNYGQTGGTSGADIDAPDAWDISTGSSNIVVGEA